jgi:hypothetical protein
MWESAVKRSRQFTVTKVRQPWPRKLLKIFLQCKGYMREDILRSIKEKVYALPNKPGVYRMLDMYGNIIYIGKAKNLKNRVSSYFLNTEKLPKVQQMVDNVYDFEYIITPSELEALNLESNLIHKHTPFYNIPV